MPIDISIIEGQPFFKGMTTRQLEMLVEDSMLAEFQAGELIMEKGDPANRFYLILSGRVALESPVLEGNAVSIQMLRVGDVLGWSWLFPPFYWHFDARAITPTKAIFFYGTRLRERCEKNHEFGYELMKRVSQIVIKRLQAARRELAEHK